MSVPQAEQPETSLTVSVGDFFDQLSSEYDQSIRRIIPQYQEIFETLISHSFLDLQAPLNVLELGCGSGNLSLFIAHLFPNARLTLVDLSPEMLAKAKEKLAPHQSRVTFLQGDFFTIDLPQEAFDWMVSSFALHHLLDEQKQELYPKIYQWLKPGGLLRVADGTGILPAEKGQTFLIPAWTEAAKAAGASDEECRVWMDHTRQYDHFGTLRNHFRWLEEAGFVDVDCYWKKLHLTIYGAQKPL